MGRSRGRARSRELSKAFSAGAARGFAGANMTNQPRTVALGDAINALTSGGRSPNGLVIDDETRWMMRDPRDEVPFGPINPLRPDALDPVRPDTGRPEPRLTEYPVAWNLPGSADQPVPWATLRAAAENVDIMRRCISVRKEQLQGLDWSITLDDQTVQGIHAASAGDTGREDVEAELRRKLLPEIDRLTTFWRNPWKANGVSFEQWVNGVMEDHLVLDAVSIYPRTTYGGELSAFELIDPTTIKLLIDYRGARPVAPFPAFQQILYGFPRAEFGSCYEADGDDSIKPVEGMLADQLFYFREEYRSFTPYGYSAVQQALISARLYLRRQGWMLAEYDDGSTPLTFLVPDATDASLAEKLTFKTRRAWEDSINAELAGQTRARNRMKVLMPGMTPHQMQGVDERYKPDYDMHLIKMLAGHFGVTSSGLGFSESKGLGNSGLHEGQADVQSAATTKPDKRMIERIVNELMCTYQGAPAELRFKFTDPDTEDQAAEDASADAQRARGTITLNDDRKRIGKSPFPFPEADMPMALLGTGWVPIEGMAARAEQAAEAEQALVEDQLATSEQSRELADAEASMPEEDIAKVAEARALITWRRKRNGRAGRPFICKALEPDDFVRGVPADVDFAEWEWQVDDESIEKAFSGNDNWRTLARDHRGRWVKRGSMRVDALGPSTPDKPVLAGLAHDAQRRRAAAAAPKRQLPVSDASSTMGGMTTPKKTPPPVPSREERAAALQASAAAMMSGAPAPKGSMAERIMARQDQSVRDVVTSLQDVPGAWVAMADVRAKLQREHGMDRGQQDAALRRLATTGDRALNTAPEDNQKTLTDADHAAAVDFGAGPQHVISLDPPRKSVGQHDAERAEREAAERAEREAAERKARPEVATDTPLPTVSPVGVETVTGVPQGPGKPWRIDGNVAQFYATKRQAQDAAEAIGWPKNSVSPVATRFQEGYAIGQGGNFLTRDAYAKLHADRNDPPRRSVLDTVRESSEQAAAASAVIDSVPGLREGVARQQGDPLTGAERATLRHREAMTAWREGRGTAAEMEAARRDMDAARRADDGPVTVREEGRQNNPGFALPTTPPAARAEAVAASTPDAPAPITASVSGVERFSGPRGRTEMKHRVRELGDMTRAQFDALPDDVKARITADLAHIGAQDDWTEAKRSARFSGSTGASGVPLEAREAARRLTGPIAPKVDNSPAAAADRVRTAGSASAARGVTFGMSKDQLIGVARELGVQYSNGWKVDKFRDEIAKKHGQPAPKPAPSISDMMAANMASSTAAAPAFGATRGKVTGDQIQQGTRVSFRGTAWHVDEKPRRARPDAQGRTGVVFRATREDQGIQSTMRVNDGSSLELAAPKGEGGKAPRPKAEAASAAPVTGAAALAAAPKSVEADDARKVDAKGTAAIERYRGKAFTEANRELRAGTPSAENARMAEQIDRVMDESRLTAPVAVHRGIGSVQSVFGDASKRSLVGHEWTDATYQSTSTEADVADRFRISEEGSRTTARVVMRVPAGVGAVQLSDERYEAELLLQRGLRMRVVSDTGPWRRGQKNPRTIEVEVIPA